MQESSNMNSKLNPKFNFRVVLLIIVLFAVGITLGILGKNFWSNYILERESIKNEITMLTEKQQLISDLEDKLDRAQKDMQILLDAKPTEADKKPGVNEVKDAYLLARIAEDRLQYANDIQTAKQLLQLAQDHLTGLNDPAIVNVKAILASDQAKLNNLNYPDVTELQQKLVLMDKLINNLPLKINAIAAAAIVDTQTEVKPEQNMRFDKEWKQALNKMLENLKTVVKLKKKDDPETNVDLSYVNTEISKAQFKLLIEQIRWAVFYKDPVVYSRSVANAQELLTQLFDDNNADVKQFADTLNYLATMKVQPDVPSITDSVNALQAILVG